MYDRGNLAVCKDAVFHESAGDNDLIAFLTEIGRYTSTPAWNSCLPGVND